MFELRQYFLLFLTATIWGSGFIGQKLGISHISPYSFTFMRTFIGGLFLLPIIYMLIKFKKVREFSNKKHSRKMLIVGSFCCGFFLLLGESFQQFGLLYTDVNKASFLTSLYMIAVPILGLFAGHRVTLKIVVAVLISVVGLYLFCMKGAFRLEHGDFLVLICAIVFAGHILVISYFVNHCDGVMLSCGQFFSASLLGFIITLFDGMPTLENTIAALPALLYVGIMSNGVAYTLQIVGQRGVNPSIASLIMSLESVMGAFFGIMLLNESMTPKEALGAALMFFAVILTQLKFKPKHLLKHRVVQTS
ncbi:MAG: DMT family transporter [Succinivibrio sp.]